MKILVNCALPYSNGSLHLGQIAGAYIAADIFVRYHRLSGNSVLYVSGSDEHGTPITISAEKMGVSPSVIADRYHYEHLETFRNLDIIFDIFTRTSYPEHQEMSDSFFDDFMKKGYLSQHEMISPYCVTCGRFMPDRYIEGTCPYCGYSGARGDQCDNCGRTLDPQELKDPRCIVSGDPPEFRTTTHLFFRLDKFQDRLLKWLEGKDFWKQNVLSYTRNFISGGLKERPITRDIEWGVRVPVKGFENKRVYVWFEALMAYVSGAIRYSKLSGAPDLWKEYYMDPEVKGYYFLGKDNIPFHTIIWPAMLIARGDLNLPYNVPANEYMTYKGEKFSKSRKVGFTVNEMLQIVPKDYIRFYLAYNLPETADTDFSLEDLESRVNTELIDKYGNFINRVLEFIARKGVNVKGPHEPDENDRSFLENMAGMEKECRDLIERVEIRKSLIQWLEMVRSANQYLNESAPWRLVKDNPEAASRKLFISMVAARDLTVLLNPYIPESSAGILESIGSKLVRDEGISMNVLGRMDDVFEPRSAGPPFKKIDMKAGNPNGLDLKVGTILSVNDHPDADRLLVLRISLGYREAQIVAGLKGRVDQDKLVGRKVVILDNIKHAKLRGIESQGMIIAADDGTTVCPVFPSDTGIKDGTEVRMGEYRYNSSGKIEKDDLQKYHLHVRVASGVAEVVAEIDGEEYVLNAGSSPLTVDASVKDGSAVR